MDAKQAANRSLEDRLHDEMIDAVDEEIELEIDDIGCPGCWRRGEQSPRTASTGTRISRNCCACRKS